MKILAILLGITGRAQEAIRANQKAINLSPNDFEVYNNLGNAFKAIGKLDDAINSYNQAITIKQDYAEAHNNMAITYKELGEFTKAIRSFKQAITIKPDYAEAYNNLAFTLNENGKLEESEKNFQNAIKLNPKYAEAYNNLGLTLKELGKLEESEKNCKKSIELQPKYFEAYNNLALTQKELGKLDDSEKNYKKAIELRPDYAEAKFNLSMLLNLKGNLELGLKLYEWRLYKKKRITKAPRKELVWDGIESIENKKFLIYEEQGFGDIFQFYRFLPLLQQKGAEVIFKVKPNLHNLLKSSNDKIRFVDTLNGNVEINFEAPLMSLPHLLKTEINTIPSYIPYLYSDNKKIDEWSKKLKTDKLKIGICWQGSKKD